MDTVVDSRLCFCLYVYFRVLELSLHRADANFKEQLVDYCRRQGLPSPHDILSIMGANDTYTRPRFLKKYLARAGVIFGYLPQVVWIPYSRWHHAQSSLRQLIYLLTAEKDVPVLDKSGLMPERWEVRYALSLASSTFGSSLPRRLTAKALFVDHLNHNVHLTVKPFWETIGENWRQRLNKGLKDELW